MSDKDKRLIGEAENTSCFVWFEIEDLMDMAESREAKERMRVIMNKKYHEEEAFAGLL